MSPESKPGALSKPGDKGADAKPAEIAVTLTPGLSDLGPIHDALHEDKPTVNILEQAQQRPNNTFACRKFETMDPKAECDCAKCVAADVAKAKKEAKKKSGFFSSSSSKVRGEEDATPREMEIGGPTNVRHVTHVNVDASTQSQAAPTWAPAASTQAVL